MQFYLLLKSKNKENTKIKSRMWYNKTFTDKKYRKVKGIF